MQTARYLVFLTLVAMVTSSAIIDRFLGKDVTEGDDPADVTIFDKLLGKNVEKTTQAEEPSDSEIGGDLELFIHNLGNDVKEMKTEMNALKDSNAFLVKQNRQIMQVVQKLHRSNRQLRRAVGSCDKEDMDMDDDEQKDGESSGDEDGITNQANCNKSETNDKDGRRSGSKNIYSKGGEVYGILARQNERIEELQSLVTKAQNEGKDSIILI